MFVFVFLFAHFLCFAFLFISFLLNFITQILSFEIYKRKNAVYTNEIFCVRGSEKDSARFLVDFLVISI